MEQADRELLLSLAATNRYVKRLYDEHMKLEKDVERFGWYAVYSSSAALKQKELKKAKLRGMETLMSIVSEHRENENLAQA